MTTPPAPANTRTLDAIATQAMARYAGLDDAALTLVSYSENAVYRVNGCRQNWALRLHRRGYHSPEAINSELAWLEAVSRDTEVIVPKPVLGRNGHLLQAIPDADGGQPHHAVLFLWQEGSEPAANDIAGFEKLGENAARLHHHVRAWQRPPGFTRHVWNFETMVGTTPHWGRWRDGIGMTMDIERVIAETVALIARRLDALGTAPDAFNLIHGDMRLANILVDGPAVKVIDFDDSGFSWLLYDCATTVSFFEDAPEVPELLRAWVRGYRTIRTLSEAHEAEISTFVMLRRILLVAWIGSHADTDLARALGKTYTRRTMALCERYLSRFGARATSTGWRQHA